MDNILRRILFRRRRNRRVRANSETSTNEHPLLPPQMIVPSSQTDNQDMSVLSNGSIHESNQSSKQGNGYPDVVLTSSGSGPAVTSENDHGVSSPSPPAINITPPPPINQSAEKDHFSKSFSRSIEDLKPQNSGLRCNKILFPKPPRPRKAMSAGSVKTDESKIKKATIRVISGISMVMLFVVVLNRGHVWMCSLIFLVEVLLFRELVRVRYNTYFHIIEETIPLFRTTQWLWFFTAIFYTYTDFIIEVIKSNNALHHYLDNAQLIPGFAFLLYSGTFVLTITTMQKDHIRFQLNQLCWTILVLCLTVGQLKYIMHNVYNGLIWFALPFMLVVSNDSFAWLTGITCGRKFIQREFLPLSPNKTWEGFLGGWIGTMIIGWYLSYYMAQYSWMTCPYNEFSLFPGPLECEPNPIFHKATNIVPPQIFEILPRKFVPMIPGVVNICMVTGDSSNLTACVSGEESHNHHHFEMVMKDFYPVQIHAIGLALFASFVAPFGGFLASAIKRAYAIKDFDSIIPGHGGLMDRMDCQFLMALYTWVHYNTFVKMATISVPKMLYMYNLMKDNEQEEFLSKITEMAGRNRFMALGKP